MKLIVCAIRDSAVAAFNRPFCVPSVGMAVRSFGDEVANEQSPMHKHPEDFELFELGTFDEDSARMENLEAPRSIARAKDFVK